MRVLHITPYYAPAYAYGGVVSAVSGLAQAQAARGLEVSVLTSDTVGPAERAVTLREKVGGVQIYRFRNFSNTVRWRYNLSQPRGFHGLLREMLPQTDIIHVHELRTVENLLLSRALPAARPGVHVRRPHVVLSAHGTLPYETGRGGIKQTWDSLFGARILRAIDHVTALTNAEAADVRALWTRLNVPVPGITVIPNGVGEEFANFSPADHTRLIRKELDLGDGPIVLFLGRLHERKGIQVLIPAFAEAVRGKADLARAHLLIVGPDEGMLETGKMLAIQTAMPTRITFAGLLTGEAKLSAFANAAIFVLPAVGEGLSITALEAMGAGLPVILTPGCNLPQIEAQDTGLLVEREVTPLAEAIRTLLRDPARRKAMGARGQTWIRSSFTWPAIAAQTIALYSELASHR